MSQREALVELLDACDQLANAGLRAGNRARRRWEAARTAARAALSTPSEEGWRPDREKVARAIYDAIDPNSGDSIATTIHLTEHIPPHGTVAEQLEQVMNTCRAAADAAIAAMLSASPAQGEG